MVPVWQPAPSMALVILASWCSPLTPNWAGLCNQCRNVGVWLPKLVHRRHCSFRLALSWIIFSGKTSCHVRRTHKQPFGQVYLGRSWGLLPAPSTILLVAWMSQLQNGPSSPSQAFRWPQPWPTSWPQSHERPWARSPQIPDPPQLGETVSIDCHSKLWGNLLHSNRHVVS